MLGSLTPAEHQSSHFHARSPARNRLRAVRSRPDLAAVRQETGAGLGGVNVDEQTNPEGTASPGNLARQDAARFPTQGDTISSTYAAQQRTHEFNNYSTTAHARASVFRPKRHEPIRANPLSNRGSK
jgi:hypothetical protein